MPPNTPSEPTPMPTPAAPAPKPRKKLLFIICIVLLLIGGAAAAWFLASKDESDSATKTTVTDATLLYAYKEGETTTVRELKSGQSSDKFSFKEITEYQESDNAYTQMTPAVDLSPDRTTFAYISKDGLFTRPLDGEATQVITSTAESDEPTDSTSYVYEPAMDNISGPGMYGLYEPLWSLDGRAVSFVIGHMEGSSVNAINLETKRYANVPETFRYIDDETLGEKFQVNMSSLPFKVMGVLPAYNLTPGSAALSAQYSKDKSLIYAVLCPKEDADEAMEGLGNGRDCTKNDEYAFIAISVSDGSYRTIATGQYNGDLLVIDQTAYLPLDDNKNVVIVNLEDETTKTVDAHALTGKASDAIGVRLFGGDEALLGIYHKSGNDYTVSVVDVSAKQYLGDIALPKSANIRILDRR